MDFIGVGIVIVVLIIFIIGLIAYLRNPSTPSGSTATAPTATLVAQPHFICSGGEAMLQWTANGDTTTLSASPAVRESLGRVANSGSMTAHVNASGVTRFTLQATRSGQPTAMARVDVQTIDTSRGLTIGGQARCQDLAGDKSYAIDCFASYY